MRLFEKIRAARLGVTRDNVEEILLILDSVAPVDEQPVELLASEVMRQLRLANADAWCAADKVGFDWANLWMIIANLIEMLMPLIVKSRPPMKVYTDPERRTQ